MKRQWIGGPQPLRSNYHDPLENLGLPENQHRKIVAHATPARRRASTVRTTQIKPTRRSSTYRAIFPNGRPDA